MSQLVVVTGAQGFLGRRTVARLADGRRRILAVDRRESATPPLPGVRHHVSDLADPATLMPSDRDPAEPFVLVHLAWDLRSRETSYAIQSAQVTCLAGLLDHWMRRGLAYVIAPGSAQEYGGCGGTLSEDARPVEPLSPYGWAKRATFEMASSWARQNGIGLLWLRPFIVYGPGQGGTMLVPYAVQQALARERAEFSDGLQVRDFVHVDDVVEAIRIGVERQPAGAHDVNLGSNDPARVRDLLQAIADHFHAGGVFQFGARPRRTAEPDLQVADTRRAAELLQWRPTVKWRDGIRRLCEEARA